MLTVLPMDIQAIAEIKAFQDFLATLTLNRELRQVKTIEMDLRGPLNPAPLLHDLFFVQKNWLGFEAFFAHYLAQNGSRLQQAFPQVPGSTLHEGLRARLYRTQFGLLTEYHAYFACRCIFGSASVRRDQAIDQLGVDFQLLGPQQCYNVHVFIDNDRAWEYRRYKLAHKSVDRLPGWHVNFPYSLRTGRFNSLRLLPNGFGIYTSTYVRYLQQEMLAGRVQHGNIVGTTTTGFVYA
jgi:TaqI restriction endonuclease